MIMTRQLIKKMFNLVGLDILKLSKSPRHALLGLKKLSIETIIDVGANRGQFAREISKFFPNSVLYCFEPLSTPFQELKSWADQQNGRVTVFNVALGDSEGVVDMMEHLDHDTSSSLLQTTDVCTTVYPFTERQSSVPVGLTSLDKAVANLAEPLTREILIKLDVQGYEDRVIKGGTEVFRQAKACIIEVSFCKLYETQAAFKDILLLLYELGYGYTGNLDQSYADNGHVIYIDAVFVKRD